MKTDVPWSQLKEEHRRNVEMLMRQSGYVSVNGAPGFYSALRRTGASGRNMKGGRLKIWNPLGIATPEAPDVLRVDEVYDILGQPARYHE